jgi:hypothetical protein
MIITVQMAIDSSQQPSRSQINTFVNIVHGAAQMDNQFTIVSSRALSNVAWDLTSERVIEKSSMETLEKI